MLPARRRQQLVDVHCTPGCRPNALRDVPLETCLDHSDGFWGYNELVLDVCGETEGGEQERRLRTLSRRSRLIRGQAVSLWRWLAPCRTPLASPTGSPCLSSSTIPAMRRRHSGFCARCRLSEALDVRKSAKRQSAQTHRCAKKMDSAFLLDERRGGSRRRPRFALSKSCTSYSTHNPSHSSEPPHVPRANMALWL